MKKSSSIFKSYVAKHVILKNRVLRYYNHEKVKSGLGDNCDGFINFDSYDVRLALDCKEITLTVKGASKQF